MFEEQRADDDYLQTPPISEKGARCHIFRALRGLKSTEENGAWPRLNAFQPGIDALRMRRAGDPDALPMLRLALEMAETFNASDFELGPEIVHLRYAVDFWSRPHVVEDRERPKRRAASDQPRRSGKTAKLYLVPSGRPASEEAPNPAA